MFCKNCGNQLADDAKFCNKCGTATTPAEPVIPEAPVAPVAPIMPEANYQAPASFGETAPEEMPEAPVSSEAPFEPAIPYIPEKPAKKGLAWWAILLIVLGCIILTLASFFVTDLLANDGKFVESIFGANPFASAEDEDEDEDKDKDKDKDKAEVDDTDADDDTDTDSDAEEEEDKDTEKEDDKPVIQQYTSGLRTEDSWQSNFLGLSYELPEGFKMVSDEEISNYVQLGADALFANGSEQNITELLNARVIYEFMAMDGAGNNLIAMAEKVPYGTSAQKVLDGAKQALLAMSSNDYKVTASDDYLEVTFGSETYYRMDIKVTFGQVSYDQTMFVRVVGDRAFCLSFTYISKAYFEDMLAGISAL